MTYELKPCRVAFEEFMSGRMFNMSTSDVEDEYIHPHTLIAWRSWQAGWNTRGDIHSPEMEKVRAALEEIRIIRRKPWTDMTDDAEQQLNDTSHIVDVCVGVAEKALAILNKITGENK